MNFVNSQPPRSPNDPNFFQLFSSFCADISDGLLINPYLIFQITECLKDVECFSFYVLKQPSCESAPVIHAGQWQQERSPTGAAIALLFKVDACALAPDRHVPDVGHGSKTPPLETCYGRAANAMRFVLNDGPRYDY
jgi:hypothetical protein